MTGPVRVLHLIDSLDDGGSQRWVWDLVRLTDRQAFTHRVQSIMLDRGNFVYADRLAEAGAYRHPLPARVLRAASGAAKEVSSLPARDVKRRWVARLWRMACYTRAAAVIPASAAQFRPHVIHAHTFQSLFVALTLKRIFSVPVIHTVPCLFSQMEEISGRWLPELYARRHNEIDLFFTGASRAELLSAGVPPGKIRWIGGVVDVALVERAASQRSEYRRALLAAIGAPDDAVIALSVGRLHPSKGHRYGMEAMGELLPVHPRLRWVVLGIGEERAEIESRARELGIADRVHLLGFHNDPLPMYAAADLYLRTTVYEAENLCSYQAMAAGLPVVGFDTGSETELLPSVGHGRLVANRDATALAAAVDAILRMSDVGRSLGALGAAYARARLDIGRTIEDYAAGYLEMMQPHIIRRYDAVEDQRRP